MDKRKDLKIVFAGTPDLAAYIMERLHKGGYPVAEAVTSPDKPRGRKGTPVPSDVKAKALELGIPVYTTARIRDPESVEHIRGLSPDMIIVAAFGQIIPKEILDMPRFGCINVHASLLPAYRGAAPIQWAVLNGDKKTGVTIMRMNEGLDTGDILSVREIDISPKETSGSLFDRMQETGAELLIDTIGDIVTGKAEGTPQPEESTTDYARMITKDMGLIDWSEDSAKIERYIRGLSPWPGSFTYMDGKMLKIWDADVADKAASGAGRDENSIFAADARPGLVSARGDMYVKTGSGALKINELQLEGKKRLKVSEFLRGRDPDGMLLGNKNN